MEPVTKLAVIEHAGVIGSTISSDLFAGRRYSWDVRVQAVLMEFERL